MNRVIEFGRSLFSYGVVLLIAVVLMGLAITIGITLAKKKNEKKALLDEDSSNE